MSLQGFGASDSPLVASRPYIINHFVAAFVRRFGLVPIYRNWSYPALHVAIAVAICDGAVNTSDANSRLEFLEVSLNWFCLTIWYVVLSTGGRCYLGLGIRNKNPSPT